MAQMTWQWLAGFFDGEGCIRFSPNGGLHLTMGQAGPRGLRCLSEIQHFLAEQGVKTGLHGPRYQYLHQRERNTPLYSLWMSHRDSVCTVGRQLLPYLRVKRVEVQDHLRYCQLFPALRSGPTFGVLVRDARAKKPNEFWRGRWKRDSTSSPDLPAAAKPSSPENCTDAAKTALS